MFTWDPKWTETGLKSQTTLKSRFVYMVISLRQRGNDSYQLISVIKVNSDRFEMSQFTWRFHCGNFPNNSKTLFHMCKWYLLINANLINAEQMLRYWSFFKQ